MSTFRRQREVMAIVTAVMALLFAALPLVAVQNKEPSLAQKEGPLPLATAYEIRALIEGQIRAILQRDYSRAYFVYTAQPFRQASSLDAFQKFVESYADYWHSAKFEWDNIRGTSSVATVNGLLTSRRQQLIITYYVMLEGPKWKILGLHLSPAPLPDPNLPQKPQEETETENTAIFQ